MGYPEPVMFRRHYAHVRANKCAFSKGQWEATARERRSLAAATSRSSSWVPVSASGASRVGGETPRIGAGVGGHLLLLGSRGVPDRRRQLLLPGCGDTQTTVGSAPKSFRLRRGGRLLRVLE